MPYELIILIIASYLLGSINSAILCCRIMGLTDPRQLGSGNPGATNVYRIGGIKPAIIVLILDVLKGTVPTWGSFHLGMDEIAIGAIAVAACLGHMFPIFFSFKGGKAVATAFGCLLPIGLGFSAVLLVIWLIMFRTFGYSSLAAIVAVGISPVYAYWFEPKYTLPMVALASLIIVRHSPNIYRLMLGVEPKSKKRL